MLKKDKLVSSQKFLDLKRQALNSPYAASAEADAMKSSAGDSPSLVTERYTGK